MKSMTGYGAATAEVGDGEVIAEIRALNHRYLDVRTVASPELGPYAHDAEQALRKAVPRGRYELRLRTTGAPPMALQLDIDSAKQVHAALAELKRELDDTTPLSAETVLGVLAEPLRAPKADSALAKHIAAVVQAAITDLDAMRLREGATLASELRTSLGAIRLHRDEAAKRCQSIVATHRKRLHDRVSALLADSDITADAGRLEVEIALLADRTDVTEELVRLESHAEQLDALLAGDANKSVGRKLDFLLQELNREANTLSAKCQDAAVTHIAVEIKAEIERMRQQAANVM